jgi:hypothetical protein
MTFCDPPVERSQDDCLMGDCWQALRLIPVEVARSGTSSLTIRPAFTNIQLLMHLFMECGLFLEENLVVNVFGQLVAVATRQVKIDSYSLLSHSCVIKSGSNRAATIRMDRLFLKSHFINGVRFGQTLSKEALFRFGVSTAACVISMVAGPFIVSYDSPLRATFCLGPELP